MKRGDFWCRVLGWLQLAGAAACAATIYFLWQAIFGWLEIEDGGFFAFVLSLVIIFFTLPAFLAGLFTVLYADKVEQAQAGLREQSHAGLRIVLALAGLWSAGVVGFVGLSFPHMGFFAVLGLLSAFIAIMGPEWTADVFQPEEAAS